MIRARIWFISIAIASAFFFQITCGQERVELDEPIAATSPEPEPEEFPDGISPTDVYAKTELLNRSLDRVIETWNQQGLGERVVHVDESDYPLAIESDLRPMHVYQTMLICTWRLQQFDDHADVRVKHIPTLASQPRVYAPRDVFFLVTMMLENVNRVGIKLGVTDMPSDESTFENKSPTDVFNEAVRVFIKLNALNGREDLRPSEVFAQMVRAAEDVRTILRQADPACRYRIDRPENEATRTPSEVFAKCLEIREQINIHARNLGMRLTPVPQQPTNALLPRDVFFQTQIIIAELNLMKLHFGTVSSTPLTIEVSDDTTPSDVYQQGLMVEYLLQQIDSAAPSRPERSSGINTP
ncbi:MAG: hypothetical protein H6822_31965 [Planctomycetaceae bacterium]|nr:hypothetical protein [Planctomycetales bacterium]MCB9926800.1 hypothetical protein [Planctomycetaceae bacterium]